MEARRGWQTLRHRQLPRTKRGHAERRQFDPRRRARSRPSPPADTEQAASLALRTGYRHIDTAAAYRNERETGRAIADSDVPRDQLYVVT
jgi:diketogulonate reductase-like aldo/keto reductase